MPTDSETPWPLVVELNGRKYRRLIPPMARGGGSWEYLSRGKWYRVYSPWLRDDLNEKAKKLEEKS